MRIDFHTHIFPKQIRENRGKYFPGEAEFETLYCQPKSKLAGAKELLASMDDGRIDRSVVFGFPWKNPDRVKLHNDYILEAVERYPGRLIGFCCLDLFSDSAVSEAERCLEKGLVGIGELACYLSGIDTQFVKRLDPIMNICRTKNLPVLIHTNEPLGHLYPGKAPMTLDQIYSLAKIFPENKIVLAHWGGGLFFFHLLKKEVQESLANIYFDTAASPFLYEPAIYKTAVDIVGSKKILWGSDYPLLKPARYFTDMQKGGLKNADIDNICGNNAAKLLKL